MIFFLYYKFNVTIDVLTYISKLISNLQIGVSQFGYSHTFQILCTSLVICFLRFFKMTRTIEFDH